MGRMNYLVVAQARSITTPEYAGWNGSSDRRKELYTATMVPYRVRQRNASQSGSKGSRMALRQRDTSRHASYIRLSYTLHAAVPYAMTRYRCGTTLIAGRSHGSSVFIVQCYTSSNRLGCGSCYVAVRMFHASRPVRTTIHSPAPGSCRHAARAGIVDARQ